MAPTISKAEVYNKKCRENPKWFLNGAMGVQPWEKQIAIIESIRDNRRTSVAGCVASSKTMAAAMASYWFLNSYFPAKVFTVAPTFRQVEINIWGEMHRLYHGARVPIGGKMLATELHFSKILYAMGMSTDDPNYIQGIHGPNVLMIVDEAQGMSEPVLQAIENVMAGGNARILFLMNPSVVSGTAFDSFHSKRAMYNAIKIPADDTPNVKAGKVVVPGMITKEQVEEWIKVYGRDSNFVRVKVFAEFPTQERDSLIPLDWIEKALVRQIPKEDEQESKIIFGMDVARFGSDATAIAAIKGRQVMPLEVFYKQDLMESTGIMKNKLDGSEGSRVGVDVIGMGSGVVDRLDEQEADVVGVNVADASDDSEKFSNLRSQIWWQMREALDPDNRDALALPRDMELVAQLSSIKYKINSKGQHVIEPKEDMRKRLGRSPDRADALCLANYIRAGGLGQSTWRPVEA